jgi:hypothetical protein
MVQSRQALSVRVAQDLLPLKVVELEFREGKAVEVDFDNLDVSIAKFLVNVLKQYRDMEVGYPAEYGNLEYWNAKLDSVIIPLEYYSQRWDHSFEEEMAIVRAGKQAMKDLADILPHLWI